MIELRSTPSDGQPTRPMEFILVPEYGRLAVDAIESDTLGPVPVWVVTLKMADIPDPVKEFPAKYIAVFPRPRPSKFMSSLATKSYDTYDEAAAHPGVVRVDRKTQTILMMDDEYWGSNNASD